MNERKMYKHREESHMRNKVRIKTKNAMRHGVQAGRNPTKRNECEDMKMIRAIEVRQETWHLHPQGESLPPLAPPLPSTSSLPTTQCHVLFQVISIC